MHRFALLFGILIACGGDNKAIPDSPLPPTPDASPDAAVPGPNAVTVTAFSPPDLVKYRDGAGGAWFDPTMNADGTFTLGVHDDYVILMLCTGSGSSTNFDGEEFAFTFTGDGSAVFASCTPPDQGSGSGSGSTFTVSGSMKQAGSVQTGGGEADSGSASWTYSIASVPAGTHDVLGIGSGTDTNMQLVRGLDVEADTTGPSLDVDGSGVAAPPVTFTLQNADPAAQGGFGFSGFGTANEFFQLFNGQLANASSAPLPMPPSTILQPTDIQFAVAVIFGSSGGQEAQLELAGSGAPTTTFALIPPFAGVNFGTSGTAMFDTLPVSTYDSLVLVNANTDQSVNQQLNFTASKSWVDKLAATTLAFDASAPGLSSKFTIDPTMLGVELDINSSDTANSVFYTTFDAGGSMFDVAKKRHVARSLRHLRQVSGAKRKILP